MPTKAPSVLRQRKGQPLSDFITQAVNRAINDGQYVIIQTDLIKSGGQLRVTARNELQLYANDKITDPAELEAHDDQRVLEALAIARRLKRRIRVFCSNNPEISVHIRAELSDQAANSAYNQCLQAGEDRTEV